MPTATTPPNRQIVLPKDWRDWRGILAGTDALEDHLREHREEVAKDR
jgi:hypothetical protein